MKIFGIKIILIIAVLLAIGLMMPTLQSRLVTSAEAYRPPVELSSAATGDTASPQTRRVVLVILSGFSDYFWTDDMMPALAQLQKTGAQIESISEPPTFRLPAWVTLLSGTPSFLADAPHFDVFDAQKRQTATETVFSVLAENGQSAAIAGNARWQDILPADIPAQTAFFSATPADSDAQVMAALARWVDDPSLSLIVAQFSQIDAAAAAGAETEAYRTALMDTDRRLEQLRKMLDLSDTTLIITADYGRLPQGGHGGDEPAVVTQPLVMVGQGITSGKYSVVRQQDIAPTIATLLGVRIPSTALGTPLLDMMALSPTDTAQVWMSVARQRQRLAENYIAAIGGTFSPPDNPEKPAGFFQAENYSGAAQLAQLIVTEMDAAINAQIAEKNRTEQRERAIPAAGVALFLLGLALWKRGTLWVEAMIAAGVAVGAYHGLYRMLGLPVSLSAILHVQQFERQIASYVGVAILLGIGTFIVLAFLRQEKFPRLEILLAGYEWLLFAIIGFGAPVLFEFWRMGVTVQWNFPPVSDLFLLLTGIWHVKWGILWGIFLPPIVAIGFWAGQIFSQKRLERRIHQSTAMEDTP